MATLLYPVLIENLLILISASKDSEDDDFFKNIIVIIVIDDARRTRESYDRLSLSSLFHGNSLHGLQPIAHEKGPSEQRTHGWHGENMAGNVGGGWKMTFGLPVGSALPSTLTTTMEDRRHGVLQRPHNPIFPTGICPVGAHCLHCMTSFI